ncbi:cobalamin B12-binding domain-containing protein [Isachenkonia alkalipeptolytica]|uniref:Cobalamin-binding protein n=1 Tax=Isachenkonia alkalipeptolytica TaxID=2565777 RepID=A0AA43XHD0_9CLOT|nr:cobalamin-dependent protein [Isachenkonia alkalipeptolytica]NBG86973.1 cobalamin-binding protein [Isachenkonia alkalipeptolytica]
MNYYQEFIKHLEKEDKENSVSYVMQLISEKELDIVTLYNEMLRPALYQIASNEKEQTITIGQEHIRTAIVRTIVECCYPFVIEERNLKFEGRPVNQEKVIIFCPEDEYHEIGPRMVEDYFALNGFETLFLGGNTPRENLIELMEDLKPDYVAISISNYYNIVPAKRSIEFLRNKLEKVPKVIVGGYALQNKSNVAEELGADLHLKTFEDIEGLRKEETDEVST